MKWIERKDLDFSFEWPYRPLNKIKGITIHHTGMESQSIEDLHAFFKNKTTARGTKYPGISYHVVINDEGVFVINDFDRKTWHSANNNSKWISLAIMGNFEEQELSFCTKNMIRFAVQTIKAVLGNHLEVEPHSKFKNTKCPGKNLSDFIQSEYKPIT